MNGVLRPPLFIAQPVCFLENNFSVDSNQNSSPEKVSGSLRANVVVFSFEQFCSIRLAESARRRDNGAENERPECNPRTMWMERHPEIIVALDIHDRNQPLAVIEEGWSSMITPVDEPARPNGPS